MSCDSTHRETDAAREARCDERPAEPLAGRRRAASGVGDRGVRPRDGVTPPDSQAGRLPHARRWGRGDLRRQSTRSAAPGHELFPRRACAGCEDHCARADGGRRRGHGHSYRDRSADARVQPHQAASAALQRGAARRQELSLHPARHGACVPAAGFLPRAAHGQGPAVRAVSERRGRARDAESAPEAVPVAPVRGQLLREPQSAVPAVPDRAVQRRPASGSSARKTTRGISSTPCCSCKVAATSSPHVSQSAWSRRRRS